MCIKHAVQLLLPDQPCSCWLGSDPVRQKFISITISPCLNHGPTVHRLNKRQVVIWEWQRPLARHLWYGTNISFIISCAVTGISRAVTGVYALQQSVFSCLVGPLHSVTRAVHICTCVMHECNGHGKILSLIYIFYSLC